MSRHRGPIAFTLVELLCVMAVISIILAVSVPALKSLGGAAGLVGAGNEVEGLLVGARQNSVSKGVLTAVVVLGNSGTASTESSYRIMTVLQLTPLASGAPPATGNWTQIERWHVLPVSVIVDNGTDSNGARSSFLSVNAISPPPPTLTYKGGTYQVATGAGSPGYYYQVFLPDGRLYQSPAPSCTLQLTNGTYSGTTPVYTGAGSDYYKLICTDATGEIKIIRP